MTVPLHQWSHASSTTIKWLGPDSEDAYNRHLSETNSRKLLETFGWIDVEITYSFNSHGYRTNEFDNRPSWMAVGCSFTQGTGVNQDERWTDVVADWIGLHCWNLGVAGSSGDTAYRIVKHYVPLLRPRFLVFLQPRYNRQELVVAQQQYPLIINWAYDHKNWDSSYVKQLLLHSENLETAAEKNREAIRSVCLQHHIPLLVYQPDAYLSLVKDLKNRDLGRDLLHPGRLNNRAFAQVVTEDIQNTC